MTDNDADAARAYGEIAEQLKLWTSSKAGAISSMETDDYDVGHVYESPGGTSMGHDDDPMAWLQGELIEDLPVPPRPPAIGRGRSRGIASPSSGGYSSTPKRTPLLERASTPVMSNSSTSKRKKSKSSMLGTPAPTPQGMDVDEPPVPVETPAPRASMKNRLPPSSRRSPMSEDEGEMEPFSSTFLLESSSQQYRRYHDALLSYLKARRSISERIDLERQEIDLMGQDNPVGDASAPIPMPSSLSDQECATERNFLLTLNRAAWSGAVSSSSGSEEKSRRQEGNLWMLLHMLRPLGLAALVWAHDQTSNGQNANAQEVYLQQLAGQVDSTPKDLIQALSLSSSSKSKVNADSFPPPPLVTQRRHQILKWLELCHDQFRANPPKPSSISSIGTGNSRTHPDDSAPALIGESSAAEEAVLQSCLSHLLAGKLDEAQEIARSHGQPWRAASWSGGAPAGVESRPNEKTETMDRFPVGNPARFLWKRQMWKSGKTLESKSPAAAAMSSILANDVHTGFQNPCLRSWERCMYLTLFGLWGRMEDQLLHLHNNNRRRAAQSAYPGTMYSRQEQEQLAATSDLAKMTEYDVVHMLLASPFEEVRGTGIYEAAAAAILIGASAIAEYCDVETRAHVQRFQGEGGNNYDVGGGEVLPLDEEDLARLRFLTHLTLYLDSLSVSTTPLVVRGIQEQRNKLLLEYVRYLSSRHEMLHLVVLYASLLPEETMLDFLPTVLVDVVDDNERKLMLEQMQELLQPAGSELPILRRTVRLLLAATNGEDDESYISDVEKCRAIQWLLQHDEHWGDALICANMLLRDFFLSQADDKIESAILLVEEYLPRDLLDRAGEDNVENPADVQQARAEYRAFLSYLDAYNDFGEWKDALSKANHTITGRDGGGTSSGVGGDGGVTETAIAQQRLVREWIRQKTDNSDAVIDAANEARKSLHNVLTHDGAWLWINECEAETEDERMTSSIEDLNNMDMERRRRNQEISIIRKRYLVLAVNFYHQVCEETAAWMSRSLDDDQGVPMVVPEGMTRRRMALQTLWGRQGAESQASSTDLSTVPLSPTYWYQHALDLAVLVANDDEHRINQAFGALELHEFLSKLAETGVSMLMDAA